MGSAARALGALVLGGVLFAAAGCRAHRVAQPTPLIRTAEGWEQAWWPIQEASAESAAGFNVVRPVSVVRQVTGLRLTQVDVEMAPPRIIYYVFGQYDSGNLMGDASRQRWVTVTENSIAGFPPKVYQPGMVNGNGITAYTEADDLNITVACDRRTDNALRIAQLLSE